MKNLIFLLLLLNTLCYGQEARIYQIKLIGSNNNEPIENAHVIIEADKKIILTDSLGQATIVTESDQVKLSHINYSPIVVSLNKDSLDLEISLKPTVRTFPEIEIKELSSEFSFNYDETALEESIQRRVNGSNLQEKEAIFPTTTKDFLVYVVSNISEDSLTLPKNEQIRCLFTVTEIGTIQVDSILLLDSVLRYELKKILEGSPKWVPAVQANKLTTTHFLLPLIDKEENIYNISEEMPYPKYGIQKFYGKIQENMRVPKSLNIRKEIFVQFVIETDGTLTNILIVKGINEELNKEAIRLVELSSGDWIPGKIKGKPVRSRFTIPIILIPN